MVRLTLSSLTGAPPNRSQAHHEGTQIVRLYGEDTVVTALLWLKGVTREGDAFAACGSETLMCERAKAGATRSGKLRSRCPTE